MKYLGFFLLLIFNLYNYQVHLNSIVYFVINFIIISFMMYFMQKKQNFILTAMEMLVFTWPISWMNIIGMPTEYLQLPWFYVFGLFIFIYTLWNFKKFYLREK